MSTKDLHTRIFPGTSYGTQALALNPTAITTDTATAGATVDTQLFEGLEFFVFATARTDGTFTPSLQDSDDGVNWTAVDPKWVLGTSAAQAITAAHVPSWLGYVGKHRYVRLVITSTNVTSGATLTAVCGQYWPHFAPTDSTFVPVN
jgi:hypothetical protein